MDFQVPASHGAGRASYFAVFFVDAMFMTCEKKHELLIFADLRYIIVYILKLFSTIFTDFFKYHKTQQNQDMMLTCNR